MSRRKKIREKEMPFLDHLEELRWRLFKILISVFVMMLVCWSFSDYLLDALLYPGTQVDPPIKLQALKVQTVFVIELEIALVAGVIFSLPIIYYQIWQFIAPGLLKKERRLMPLIIFSAVFLFLIGAAFAYFLIIPIALQYFLGLSPSYVENNIAIDFYIGFLLRLILVFGIVFELPIVSAILARFGLISVKFMRKYRRHSIVAAFIIGAILTPPDPITQTMLAIPLIILYELSIYIVKIFERKRTVENDSNP